MPFDLMKLGAGNMAHDLTGSQPKSQSVAITTWEEIMRDRLLQLQAKLEADADAAEGAAAIVELDQSKVGRLSRMDAMQAQAMAKASVQRRDAALRRIAAAIKRIDEGEYGRCQKCDEAINPKRLEIDPTVLLCIDCANQSENS